MDIGSSDQLSRATAIPVSSIINMNGYPGGLDPSGTRAHLTITSAKLGGGGYKMEDTHRYSTVPSSSVVNIHLVLEDVLCCYCTPVTLWSSPR